MLTCRQRRIYVETTFHVAGEFSGITDSICPLCTPTLPDCAFELQTKMCCEFSDTSVFPFMVYFIRYFSEGFMYFLIRNHAQLSRCKSL